MSNKDKKHDKKGKKDLEWKNALPLFIAAAGGAEDASPSTRVERDRRLNRRDASTPRSPAGGSVPISAQAVIIDLLGLLDKAARARCPSTLEHHRDSSARVEAVLARKRAASRREQREEERELVPGSSRAFPASPRRASRRYSSST